LKDDAMVQRLLAALILVVTLFGPLGAATAQAQNCVFVLGFATLHGLIPQIVGNCLEDEHHNSVNGDGLQATTGVNGAGGLLVWRKADNFTAFTDGFRTWVNGPFGLQMRLNSQRFFWESNPEMLAIIPPPTPGDRCHTAGLSLTSGMVDAGAGNFHDTFSFKNNTNVSCTFFGFVGASLLDARNNGLPTNVVRGGGFFPTHPVPTTVTVPAGGTASFMVHWEDVPVGNETSCPTSAFLAVTPPDEFDPIIIPMMIVACGHGELDISPVF
jgi:hypothetical protein